MPRTKVTAHTESDIENIKPKKFKIKQDEIDQYFKAVEKEVTLRKEIMKTESDRNTLNFYNALEELSLKLPQTSKTWGELMQMPSEGTSTLFESALMKSINSTRTGRKVTTAKKEESSLLRSASRSTARPKIQKLKTTRSSRSLSRSKVQLAMPIMNTLATPVGHNIPTATFGMVTPKVKPNTPQVLLRRPKEGEMAISMQGSPLMVGSVSSDHKANVNIPLPDGYILSVQPERGLRKSQVPNLDPEIIRQIEKLRDNLNTVCAFSVRK